ncbi:uncharacterized protein LOC131242986 [Magnolia sinica]|uniref:uncharacterized protein LOC131242986 n=1 Tax=Magnolia sinica TaxID=86752 RepID=UPI002659CFD5|nr:uncharacterized protein LOC131242986 [Magnolia sinica]
MAFASTSSTPLLLLFLFSLIYLSSIVANARPGLHFHPCNTLFISLTISSSKPPFHFSFSSDQQNPSGFFALLREIDESNPKPFLPSPNLFLDRPEFPQSIHFDGISDGPHKPTIPRHVPFGSLGASSLRDRTNDILSIVVSLLFGVSCGALTAATMYLAWSVIMSKCDEEEFNVEDGNNNVGPKAMGYVKIPTASVAKEGYEGN